MKPGPATSTLAIEAIGAQLFGNGFGQFARLAAGVLGQHHRRIGRHVAMRGLARRLDHDARLVDAGGQDAGRDQLAVGGVNLVEHDGKDVLRLVIHGSRRGAPRLTQFRRRVKKPRVLDERVAVGHPGDEIGDPAQPPVIVAGLDAVRPVRRQVRRRRRIAREQVADHLLGLRHDAVRCGPARYMRG